MVLALVLGSAAPALAQDDPAPSRGTEPAAEERADRTVTCRLPAGIDRLGTQLTKAAPQRTIETTAEDCEARSGEVVDEPR